jgi:hypothetical protein
LLRLVSATFFFIAILLSFVLLAAPSAFAAIYYEAQTNFTETSIPTAGFTWHDNLQICIFKQADIPNSYYVWTKLAVQEWRQAVREYTSNQRGWNMTAHYAPSESQMENCNVKVHIYDTYKEFPEYPRQTGAYTAVEYSNGIADSANVFLSPLVLHGDGKTEIKLPDYAFRNSAVHEVGHILGLAHMKSEKGYLMSPIFDYFENKDQLPITTLELSTLVKLYGKDGFSS